MCLLSLRTLVLLSLDCLLLSSVQAAAHSAAQSQRSPHVAHLLQLSGVALSLPVLRLQQVTEYIDTWILHEYSHFLGLYKPTSTPLLYIKGFIALLHFLQHYIHIVTDLMIMQIQIMNTKSNPLIDYDVLLLIKLLSRI